MRPSRIQGDFLCVCGERAFGHFFSLIKTKMVIKTKTVLTFRAKRYIIYDEENLKNDIGNKRKEKTK